MTDPASLSSEPLFGLPLPDLWFGLLFFIFALFLFLDGFDFGVGVLFATRDDEEERERLLAAIGPFWDGNEVWLVVFGGAMFAAFPAVYANLFSRHYLLMFAILGALILRGLAPEMYEQRHDEAWQRWWGRSFVVGSLTAPFFLGMFTANWLFGATAIVTLPGIVVGLAVVALTVVDGVAFLRLKTRGELRVDLKTAGYYALAAYLALVVVTLGAVYWTAPALRPDLFSVPIAALVVATLAFAGVYAAATRTDRYYVAFGAAAGLVFALVAIVAGLLYPTIDPVAGLTVESAIVSTLPLNLMSIGAAVLLPLVFVYFVVLYSAFSGPIEAGESY
ncbi:cytochrome D ubiquinol oxidase subunit II [Halobiforma lacisalsi AJ5]|uniref:Cytochrome D ubiquinol oxidase subunit II n=1 Tax=Natronobacterium lacisalsi AJ5 TaxID=358396 RepID=M0LR78_NATLA|nr:cytochrome d ubiquinol oxidase subunit II [Halobiforma lacisalsi]APW99621.1 cytochrome D ubiquinol oxidase subunit II [Halobiforma lacisalsi AJ5]EMA35593.1 cytochrome d ubiquinol oxidase, subunit II [Halobiforma lacisalsi AJ5]